MTTYPELVISRVFDAPRELVFKAWTEPAQFANWFGPRGTTVPYCEMDVRPGGTLRFRYRLSGGEQHRISGVYREVLEPERLVFTESFIDEAGDLIERPGYPLVALLTVTFAEQGGKTRVTVQHGGVGVDHGQFQGWNESLERLAHYIEYPGGERPLC